MSRYCTHVPILHPVKDSQGNLIAEYVYDPFGRRVNKTVYDPPGQNPETTWYVYSDQGLMAELDEAGNETDFYLFPPDGLWSTDPILRKSGSSYYYYQTDHLGTPQQLIDGAGAVVHSREMRAFGEVAISGMEDRWRFPGQLESAETGLYYNRFRDYESLTSRYVQSDPIGLGGGFNTYLYVENSPLSSTDSLGLFGRPGWQGGSGFGRRSSDATFSGGLGGFGHFLTLGLALESGFTVDTNGTFCFYTRSCPMAGIGMAGSLGVSGGMGTGYLCSGYYLGSGAFGAGGFGLGGGTSMESFASSDGTNSEVSLGRGMLGLSGGKAAAIIGCEYWFFCINESDECSDDPCEG